MSPPGFPIWIEIFNSPNNFQFFFQLYVLSHHTSCSKCIKLYQLLTNSLEGIFKINKKLEAFFFSLFKRKLTSTSITFFIIKKDNENLLFMKFYWNWPTHLLRLQITQILQLYYRFDSLMADKLFPECFRWEMKDVGCTALLINLQVINGFRLG